MAAIFFLFCTAADLRFLFLFLPFCTKNITADGFVSGMNGCTGVQPLNIYRQRKLSLCYFFAQNFTISERLPYRVIVPSETSASVGACVMPRARQRSA